MLISPLRVIAAARFAAVGTLSTLARKTVSGCKVVITLNLENAGNENRYRWVCMVFMKYTYWGEIGCLFDLDYCLLDWKCLSNRWGHWSFRYEWKVLQKRYSVLCYKMTLIAIFFSSPNLVGFGLYSINLSMCLLLFRIKFWVFIKQTQQGREKINGKQFISARFPSNRKKVFQNKLVPTPGLRDKRKR